MAKCFFSGVEAKGTTLGEYNGVSIKSDDYGEYWITGLAFEVYEGGAKLSHKERCMCLQETILINREGLIPFWTLGKVEKPSNDPRIVFRNIEDVKSRPIDHREKDKKIMSAVADKLEGSLNPFKLVRLSIADLVSIAVFDDDDFLNWILHLRNEDLICLDSELESLFQAGSTIEEVKGAFISGLRTMESIGLTVKGWEKVRERSIPSLSRKVFLAMAFTDREGKPLPSEVRDQLKKTLEQNWNPIIVDEVEHNDGIMDKVIASINESRFVIAELTHQKSGVYYEAGYAKGRGLQVIHIVKKDDLERCHFDVKHLNLIVWNDLDDLKTKLENRIKATII